jgi:hypothetical protein
LLHDAALRNVFAQDPHVLVAVHWRIELKIFNIVCHPASVLRGDGAVEEELDCGEFGCDCVDLSFVIDAISSAGESDLFCSCFVRSMTGNDF